MTITYPLSFPTIGIVQSAFRFHPIIGESTSIFTGASQVYRHQGEWWEGEVKFRAMNHVQVGQVKAFLTSLRGKYGTFLYGDPDYLARGPNGALGGTPLVNGSVGQGVNILPTKGWTPFTTVLKKGDYIQLGSGSTARLHMITQDADTDSIGDVDLDIEPRTRTTYIDNAVITTSAPKCIMRLSENPVEWSANQSSIYEVSIAFKESLEI